MGNWQNGVTPLNETNMGHLYDLRMGSEAIAANTDLNNLTTPGTYKCVSRANAETLTNSPYTIGYFKLIVENISSNDGDHIRQTILTGARNTFVFIRTNDANGWGEWNIVMTGNYSTTEKRVGMWTSGKPIYRRVFTSTEFLNTYSTGIGNISEIVDFRGLVYRKDYPNMVHTIPSRFSRSGYEIDLESLAKNSGGLQIAIAWGSSYDDTKVNKVVFIIEYTKTTD